METAEDLSSKEVKLACLLASYEMDSPHVSSPDLEVGKEENQHYPAIPPEKFLAWLLTEHHGDCIKLPSPCIRCFADSQSQMDFEKIMKKCEKCGKKIPKERLAALPDTRLCVKCSENIGGDYIVEYQEHYADPFEPQTDIRIVKKLREIK